MGVEEKVKLLCSFGGEFVREQGKLFYLGGKTRLVSIERCVSFRSLASKMAELCNADLSLIELKYQLPDGSLDSRLISVETDDDVSNMMDEFDPHRKIPIFLFTDRARSSEGEDEDDYEEIANAEDDDCMPVIDSFDMDSMREASTIALGEPFNSQNDPNCSATSSMRDSAALNSSSGPSMSGEMFRRESQSLVVGQEYENVHMFRNALTSAAIAANFELHMIRSDQRRVTARCAAEGCTWRVHASKLPQVNKFRIRTLMPDHTCERSGDAGHRQATAKWIANCIREKLRQNRNYRPKEIVIDIHREYGVLITYKRAFLAREKALEELQAEPVRCTVALDNIYEHVMESSNMDAQTWGEIHDPPRKKRAYGVHQPKEVRPLHCTRCNRIGHNRRTCTVLELLHDASS